VIRLEKKWKVEHILGDSGAVDDLGSHDGVVERNKERTWTISNRPRG
jgi:hypothetical protein